MERARQMPDFAGVALVDILANGVGMLIIVIVVSIASRVEREERYAEQADEVASVMSHKFSTSLVLNSLAASPPAVLHNYDNSAIDQVLDPQVMPIIELHPAFVREFYSGARWSRRELLREFNGMHAWLSSLSLEQKKRVRTDIYDVGQYYLAMSILREHGVRIAHWHFLTGPLSPAAAANCPPGVAAKDCRSGGDDTAAPPPALAGKSDRAEQSNGELGDSGWPQFGGGGNANGDGDGDSPGRMPEGAVPGFAGGLDGNGGGGQGGDGSGGGDSGSGSGNEGMPGGGGGGGGQSAADLGSFPGLREGLGGAGSGSGGGQPAQNGRGGGSGDSIQFRMALPEALRRAAGLGAAGVPPLDLMFAALLHYLGDLQDTLDSGYSPSAHIAGFASRLRNAFAAPPLLNPRERMLARELAVQTAFLRLDPAEAANTIAIEPLVPAPGRLHSGDAILAIAPNRLLEKIGVRRSGESDEEELPAQARVSLRLNAFPGIWKGLDVRLEKNALLLMPPQPREPQQLRWRALAYLSPKLDEVVVGFALADFDAHGDLHVQADAGGVSIQGRALFSRYKESAFGARGWLVTLYAALVAGLLALALARRRFGRRA